MMTDVFFFDTYAIIEVIEGSKPYERYISSKAIVTKLNLFEICHFLYRRDFSEEEADKIVSEYSKCVVDYSPQSIRDAARLKIKNRTLSMTDCIGYQVAQEYGLKFLTGDKEFENMEGVEFVKR